MTTDSDTAIVNRLQRLGGQWDPDRRIWTVPASRGVELTALLDEAGLAGELATRRTRVLRDEQGRVVGTESAPDRLTCKPRQTGVRSEPPPERR